MVEGGEDAIEGALEVLVLVMEKSGNIRKDLKK